MTLAEGLGTCILLCTALAVWGLYLQWRVCFIDKCMKGFDVRVRAKLESLENALDEAVAHNKTNHTRLHVLEHPYEDDHQKVFIAWDEGSGRLLGVFKSESSARAVKRSFSEDDRETISIHPTELAE